MTAEWLPQVVSYEAGQAFAEADRNTFVKLNAAGKVVKVTALTDRPIGVLRDDTRNLDNGSTVGVYEGDGAASVKLSGSNVAPGDFIGVTATGLGKKLTAGTDTTQYICGTAIEAGVAGDKILVHVVIPTAKAA